VRVTGGLIRPSTRSQYVGAVRRRISAMLAPTGQGVCIVCGSAARIRTVTQATAGAAARPPRTFRVLTCRVCGHVGNPENTHDYRNYLSIDKLTPSARIGTPERPGREFHMAAMAIDILGRDDIEVLIFGAGRSFDNHHIAALPQVRNVAIADIMRLRDDAEFIDANLPAPRRFAVVIASEVVEHFLDPRKDFASFFDYLEPDGLLVCSTNLYDGGDLSKQAYVFYRGHVSYYSPESLARIAAENDHFLDLRVPFVATGYAGQRKRYLLFTKSAAVMEATARYFSTRRYAPSDSPTADLEFVATQATSDEGATPVGSGR
jgi:SAM-dependent methyltransferase